MKCRCHLKAELQFKAFGFRICHHFEKHLIPWDECLPSF